jgi:hypothetical protein
VDTGLDQPKFPNSGTKFKNIYIKKKLHIQEPSCMQKGTTRMYLEYTGWMAQNGEFINVRFEITISVEYINSTKCGLV